jgi:hypothetical protein
MGDFRRIAHGPYEESTIWLRRFPVWLKSRNSNRGVSDANGLEETVKTCVKCI